MGGGGDRGATVESGNAQDGTLSASVGRIQFDTSKNGTGSATGELAAAGAWTPPPCWYAPTYTPAQFKKVGESIWYKPTPELKLPSPTAVGRYTASTELSRYKYGQPYTDFNMAKMGKGYWWTSFPNPDLKNNPAASSCDSDPFWVDNGQPPPPVRNAVTPEVLAELAYAKIRVPGTKVNLSPAGIQTVNLNTWAWLSKGAVKPVSVTASVPSIGISATTTATPIALHIDPGTQNANVYPTSGDCPITPDGSIGTPYQPADGNNIPPCGLTYLRATTGSSPYPFTAALTWKISWTGTGTGGVGGNLPNGTFGTTTPLTVQEIQTVVR